MFRRRRDPDDFAAEIEAHLQFEAERLTDDGLDAADARAAAQRTFGNVAMRVERFYESQRWAWWDRLSQDVRYAVRAWRKSPGFAVVAVLTMAIGVGATTAIFTVVDATLLHPLPYPHPDGLVSVVADLPGVNSYDIGLSQPEWQDLEHSGIFDHVTPVWFDENNLTGLSRPARVGLMSVAPNYFAVLGVAPQIGRAFPPDNYTSGYLLEVVISDGLWKRAFGGRSDILTQSIRLDTDLYRIVGVMPPDFHPPGRSPDERTVDVWAATSFFGPPIGDHPPRNNRMMPAAIARLHPGVTRAAAQQQLDAFVATVRRQYPNDYPERTAWTLHLVPLADTVVGDVRRSLMLILGAVALVLLIGCVNIANVLLARATSRTREFAVRQALGAGRRRLIRQLLTESVCLSIVGGAAGLGTLVLMKQSLVRLIPQGLPRLNDITLNWTVLSFALLTTVAAGIVFGLAPALGAGRQDVTGALKSDGRASSAGRGHARVRRLLVVTELALSVVLMVAAGLLGRSFLDLLHARLGFTPDRIMAIRTRLPYPNDVTIDKYRTIGQEAPFLREVLRRARALPGVEDAAIASSSAIPLDHAARDLNTMPMLIEGRGADTSQAPLVDGSVVTPEYFRLLGMTLVRGRAFTPFDDENAPPVAVVNEAMARTYWPDADPIGQHVKLTRNPASWTTIVGIVANARTEALHESGVPIIYASAYQSRSKHLAIFLRGQVDAGRTPDRVRQLVQSIDDTLPVFGAQMLTDTVSASLASRRLSMEMVGAFAVTALLLAALGIYGVLAYMVNARTHEIGIRVALGAGRFELLSMIFGQGAALVATGLATGVLCAAIVSRAMAGMLYGVRPTDPATFLGVTGMLGVVALVACYVPARRALRIDPLLALRGD
ncbi:MAG TPA: ABC transporter permease [Vicinamibacterales bacterium]|nr:ABC transporter permease [Vicinamibacterales bacterium]